MKKKVVFILIIFLLTGMTVNSATKTKAKKVSAEEVLQNGREAFFNYDFEEAADLYDQYRTLQTKAKQPLDEEFEIWESELEIASNAIDRVQRIVIVDSISIPSAKFYEAYKLSESAGKIGPYSVLSSTGNNKELSYLNEGEDYLLYPQVNSDGDLRLYEKSLLLDGNWEEKETLEGDFDKSGDYAFPFMSADGQTLYFANNGDDSMGGYDIFIAQKDALTGEYRQPLNLGMPFNSPYNDLMFAIDEENGLGWWATDRNSPEGKITVYVYLYEDIRKNYPADTENLADYAKLTSYKDTWFDDKDQAIVPVMPSISKTLHASQDAKKDFVFPLGNGKTYYSFSDFKNRKAADVMKQYLAKSSDLEKREIALLELRQQYKSDKSVQSKIIQSETEIEDLRSHTKALRSEVLRLEKSVR
ncbi:MAG: hypothetical protein J1E16_06755 [Muribaculaceae bacterium]|nr:hypothetical protein [Muribaculaceae bacterium]